VSSTAFDDILREKALPDEVAAGHAGRLSLVNDYPNARLFLDATRLQLNGPSRALQYPDCIGGESGSRMRLRRSLASHTDTLWEGLARGASPGSCHPVYRLDPLSLDHSR
jgi:hypothetical protein